jgi:hypothetical protein
MTAEVVERGRKSACHSGVGINCMVRLLKISASKAAGIPDAEAHL